MTSLVAALLVIPGTILMLASCWLTFTSQPGSERRARSEGLCALSLLLICVAQVLYREWALAGLSAAGLAVSAWLWWQDRRRRRDRAPRSYGYKARAAIAALVRRARESARSRPVLRPVPGGAS